MADSDESERRAGISPEALSECGWRRGRASLRSSEGGEKRKGGRQTEGEDEVDRTRKVLDADRYRSEEAERPSAMPSRRWRFQSLPGRQQLVLASASALHKSACSECSQDNLKEVGLSTKSRQLSVSRHSQTGVLDVERAACFSRGAGSGAEEVATGLGPSVAASSSRLRSGLCRGLFMPGEWVLRLRSRAGSAS